MVRSLYRAVLCSLALGLLLAQASTAFAETPRELFLRGQTAYKQGDYDAAIRDWQNAYAKDPRPLLQYNIAQAWERLGKIEQAITALDLYLDKAKADDPYQADARARRAALATRLQNTGVRIVEAPEG